MCGSFYQLSWLLPFHGHATRNTTLAYQGCLHCDAPMHVLTTRTHCVVQLCETSTLYVQASLLLRMPLFCPPWILILVPATNYAYCFVTAAGRLCGW